MKEPPTVPIQNCAPVLVKANADDRGCLFEIFREEWVGAFKALQWNACSSRSGVMRGVHVHIDYDEFYTLPMGRVFIALRDIRKASPTFGNSIGFEWSAVDGFAVSVPAGVAHAVFFLDDSVLIREDPGYRERIPEAATVNEAMDRFRNERCCAGCCYDRFIGC
jgi:dTDP-4-dehydrorhamnose 3,5-epimerase